MSTTERIIETVIELPFVDKRIDIFLAEKFTYYSRNQWQNAIKFEKILVNGKPTRASKTLKLADKIKFLFSKKEPDINPNYQIIFEDEYCLIVNKPAMLPCHPAGIYFKNTLWYLLSQKYEHIALINRLDRETSGLIILTKSKPATAKFAKLLSEDKIEKKYYALVHGLLESYHAKGWLIADENSEVSKKRLYTEEQPEEKSETAETIFNKLNDSEKYSLLDVTLKTGRMHQIRATLFSLGFPVIGDKLYGLDDNYFLKFIKNELTKEDKTNLIISRQALQAYGLSFKHPFTNENLSLKLDLDIELQNVSDEDLDNVVLLDESSEVPEIKNISRIAKIAEIKEKIECELRKN